MNEKMKKLVNEHAITILCVISIIALFMPMFSVVTSMDVWGETSSETMTISGFEVMQEDKIGMLLVVGPAILIAMNYVKQLQKYKGILAIAAPLVCIVSFIACMIYAKNGNITAGESGIFRVDVKIKLAFGGLLALLSYLATTVGGAVVYHNFTLDKGWIREIEN